MCLDGCGRALKRGQALYQMPCTRMRICYYGRTFWCNISTLFWGNAPPSFLGYSSLRVSVFDALSNYIFVKNVQEQQIVPVNLLAIDAFYIKTFKLYGICRRSWRISSAFCLFPTVHVSYIPPFSSHQRSGSCEFSSGQSMDCTGNANSFRRAVSLNGF